jgi:hypothetical protein
LVEKIINVGPPLGLINVGKKERFSPTLFHSIYITKEKIEQNCPNLTPWQKMVGRRVSRQTRRRGHWYR